MSIVGSDAHEDVDMRIVGVPMIDGYPVEPVPRSRSASLIGSLVKARRSVISLASSGETMNRK